MCLHLTIAEFSCLFFKLYLDFNSCPPISEFSGSYNLISVQFIDYAVRTLGL